MSNVVWHAAAEKPAEKGRYLTLFKMFRSDPDNMLRYEPPEGVEIL